MKQLWDERYGATEFAFGEEPNQYFKAKLVEFSPGKILMPGEGEGRNGVFAATLGWDVVAFDLSGEGKKKAENLAEKHGVTLEYQVGEFSALEFQAQSFDAIGLIFAHFPPTVKAIYHKKLDSLLKPGGILIIEGFSKNHLKFSTENPKAGGPKNEDMLYSIDEIRRDFGKYDILELTEKEVTLSEGLYHVGKSSVVRFVGRRK